jgi:hypothetical protein
MDTMETDKNTSLQNTASNKGIISFFEKDADFAYVFKKTEKLATALYMVTNLFPSEEPMKWTLRKKVSELLSCVVDYKDMLAGQQDEFTRNISGRVLEIVSLLEIGCQAGLLSQMNFSILNNEFSNLLSTLEASHVRSENLNVPLSPSFFDIAHSTPARSQQSFPQHSFHPSPAEYHTASAHTDSIKDRAPAMPNVFKKNDRQNSILRLLKMKKNLTIKDIAEVVTDCSEKTIQRELISLISAGVLKKSGERRWTRYSLASETE